MPNTQYSYNAEGSHNITLPPSWTSVQIDIVGGGQGGGAASSDSGGTGGAGGRAGKAIRHTLANPGVVGGTLAVVVGADGLPGLTAGSLAAAGGDTTVSLNGNLVACAPGGNSISASVGTTQVSGGQGVTPTAGDKTGGGGGGSSVMSDTMGGNAIGRFGGVGQGLGNTGGAGGIGNGSNASVVINGQRPITDRDDARGAGGGGGAVAADLTLGLGGYAGDGYAVINVIYNASGRQRRILLKGTN